MNKKLSIAFLVIVVALVAVALLVAQKTKKEFPEIIIDKPKWWDSIPVEPEWWAQIEVLIPEGFTESEHLQKTEKMEKTIRDTLISGIPPTEERKRLIKYLSWMVQEFDGPLHKGYYQMQKAYLYHCMGEYKRCAKECWKVVEWYPNESSGALELIGREFEMLGDYEHAREAYEIVLKYFRGNENEFTRRSARIALQCFDKTTRPLSFNKPDWWEDVSGVPEWWDDVDLKLPAMTSWDDLLRYVMCVIGKDKDMRRQVKAYTYLLTWVPSDLRQKALAQTGIASAYRKTEDYKRSIINYRKVIEQFPNYSFWATNASHMMGENFLDLGDKKRARESFENILKYYPEEKTAVEEAKKRLVDLVNMEK